jgi:hypothetical protein
MPADQESRLAGGITFRFVWRPRQLADQSRRSVSALIPSAAKTLPGLLPASPPAGATAAGTGPSYPLPLPEAPDDDPPAEQADFFRRMTWTGDVPPHMWMNFYTKVLSKHATDKNLKLKVSFEATPAAGISKEKLEETKTALRELGLGGGELKGE